MDQVTATELRDPVAYVGRLLDDAKSALGISADAGLARAIDVTTATLSQWRGGTYPLPDKRVLQLAAIARRDPALSLLCYMYARGDEETRRHLLTVVLLEEELAKELRGEGVDPRAETAPPGKVRAALKRAVKKVAGAAVLTFATFAAATLPPPASARSTSDLGRSSDNSVSYVRRRWGRRRRPVWNSYYPRRA